MATARLTASPTRASATAASRIRPSANRDKALYYQARQRTNPVRPVRRSPGSYVEEQEEVVKALAADTEAVLMEKMNDKFTEDSDSDEEEELKKPGGRG